VPAFTSVVFWLDGVIVPPVWQCARAVIEAEGVAVTPALCFRLIDLAGELKTGATDSEQFCRRVIEHAPVKLSPPQLAAAIERRIEPIFGVVQVMNELARASYRLAVLADYPPLWMSTALSRGGLERLLVEHQVVMTAQYASADLFTAIGRMLAVLQLKIEDSLLVDADPLRGMALLRAGFKTATFVDAPRLRREFVLRAMLPARGLSLRDMMADISA